MSSAIRLPNRIRCTLLFDSRIEALDAIVRDFARVEEMKSGTIFNVPKNRPDESAHLENADQNLALSFEYVSSPPEMTKMETALQSPVTQKLFPDIKSRIARSVGHLILEVWLNDNEALSDNQMLTDPEILALEQNRFHRRLELLALMSRIVFDHASPTVVYWAQSDRLFTSEVFDTLAARPIPSPLHIHPMPFGPKRQALDTSPKLTGVRTSGAQHWLGGEVIINPVAQDWQVSFQAILAFITANSSSEHRTRGYGDVFDPDDHNQRYRIDHASGSNEGKTGPHLLYELVPLDPAAPAMVQTAHSPKPEDNRLSMPNTGGRPVFGRKRT
ncbi:MAG: hypothetical protein AAGL10_08960 [Pseudomonadota bacterium]